MPSLPSITPVEQACGLPVLSAATATTYAILRALDLPTVVPNAGHLLSGEVQPRAQKRQPVGVGVGYTPVTEGATSPELLTALRRGEP